MAVVEPRPEYVLERVLGEIANTVNANTVYRVSVERVLEAGGPPDGDVRLVVDMRAGGRPKSLEPRLLVQS